MSKEQILIDALKTIQSKIPEGEDYDPGQFVYDVEHIVSKAISLHAQSQQESQPSKETTYYRTVKASDPPKKSNCYFLLRHNGVALDIAYYDADKKEWYNWIGSEPNKSETFFYLEPIPSPESDTVELLKRIAKDYALNDGLFYHNDDEDGDGPLLPEQLYSQLKSQKQ